MSSARPADPQSWNRYTYCGNDPLNNVDPTGLDWWYHTGESPAQPEWKDQDPGKGYERWYAVSSYIYYSVASKQWWALNPAKNESQSFATRGEAQAAFDAFNGTAKDSTLSATAGQIEFLGGIDSGISPLMPIIDVINAANGLDITSRDYSTGKALGFGIATGLTFGLAGAVEVAEEGTSAALTEDVASTFANSEYRTITLQSDVTAYRYSGGSSRPIGSFLTTQQTVRQISSPLEARQLLSLPPGATAETLNVLTIPKGTTIFVGRVAGGGPRATQIFVSNPGVLGGP